MKDTRLNEDAAIYNRQKPQSEKEKWKNLSSKEKKQYFKDYYFKPLLLSLFIILIVGWLLYSIFSPKPKTVLTVSLINCTMSDENADTLASSLEDYLEIDKNKENVYIDTSLFIDTENRSEASMASEQKMSIYSFSGEYDIIIAERELFDRYAANGFFYSLAEALPSNLYNEFSSNFVMSKVKDLGNEELPYGISIKGYKRFDELDAIMIDPVIAIAANGKNRENAVNTIQWLTH